MGEGQNPPPPIVTGLKDMMELSSNLKELYRSKFYSIFISQLYPLNLLSEYIHEKIIVVLRFKKKMHSKNFLPCFCGINPQVTFREEPLFKIIHFQREKRRIS